MLKQELRLISLRKDLHKARWLFWLFLASLGTFFLASLATYVIIRLQAARPMQSGNEYVALELPMSFWLSTVLMLMTSVLLERSIWFVRREKPAGFRQSLIWAAVAAGAFLLVQSSAMSQLLVTHFSAIDGSTKFYGMTFALAFVHAAHVLGGEVFLVYIIIRAWQNRLDHERYWSVTHCAGYWHFLDIVWLAMLATFWFTG